MTVLYKVQTNEEEVQHLLLLASVCSVMIISKLKFGPIEKSVIAHITYVELVYVVPQKWHLTLEDWLHMPN